MLQNLIYDLSPFDPLTFASAGFIVIVVAMLA